MRAGALIVGVIAMVVGAACGARAATLTTVDSRGAFAAALGGLTAQDFNGFAAEAFFDEAALDLGGFSAFKTGGVVLTGSGARRRNKLDLAPAEPRFLGIDGTAFLNVLIQTGDTFVLEFDTAVRGFGADFSQFNEVARVRVSADGGAFVDPSLAPGTRFFGVVSDQGFRTLTFTAARSENFGLDNAVFATVPLPAGLPLLAAALALGVAWRRARGA